MSCKPRNVRSVNKVNAATVHLRANTLAKNALRALTLTTPIVMMTLCMSILTVKASLTQFGLSLARKATSKLPREWSGLQDGMTWYGRAMADYRLDSTACDELFEVLIQVGENVAQLSEAQLKDLPMPRLLGDPYLEFPKRDPFNGLHHHYLAVLNLQLYEKQRRRCEEKYGNQPQSDELDDQIRALIGGQPATGTLESAISNARMALATHPTSPQRHLFLAELLERRAALDGITEARVLMCMSYGQDTPDKRAYFAAQAAAELQTALDLDSRRIYVSPLHRMTKETREAIANRIARLKSPSTQ